MKILHVYKDYFPVLGGIENHIRTLAEAQASAGHQVTVSVCNPGKRAETETLGGVTIVKSGRLCTLASMPLSFSQLSFLKSQRPDIVHVHSPYPLGEVGARWFQKRTPMVITYHSDVIRQKYLLRVYAPFLRGVLEHAERIVATSAKYIESSPWLGAHKEKCRIVPLGVDPLLFHPAEPPHPIGRRLLFVGKLRYYKGLGNLLQALAALPDVYLDIVGEGPMREAWQSMVERLLLSERVSFLGEVGDRDLPDRYRSADLFVLPANSRAEAFGSVLLEAMASGLPCISTEVGSGTSWIVQSGVTGYVVPPNDPGSLGAAIREAFSDPRRLRQMGRAGRARVEAEFTAQKMIEGVMQVYGECLAVPCGKGTILGDR